MQLLSGRILKPLMADRFATGYTSSLQVIPASRSQSQDKDGDTKTPDTFGRILNESFRQLDLFGVSSRTSADTLQLDTPQFIEAYDLWVTKLRQDCLQRQRSALRTNEKGCLSWPTSTVSDTEGGLVSAKATKTGFRNPNKHGSKLKEAVAEVQNWPTPTGAEAQKISNQPNFGQICLSNHPAIRGKPQRSKSHKDYKGIPKDGLLDQDSLNTNGKNRELWNQSKQWSTPEAKNQTGYQVDSRGKRTPRLGKQAQGKLNPDWVEQLMGLQVGWTDLGCWATELSPNVQKEHLEP